MLVEFAGLQQNTRQGVMIPRPLGDRQARAGTCRMRPSGLSVVVAAASFSFCHPCFLSVILANARIQSRYFYERRKKKNPGSPIGVGDDSRARSACGVSPPRDEVPSLCSGQALLFRQKDPKPWAPRRGPPGSFAPVPTVRAAELASLKQSSPPYRVRDRGAATPAGAMRWRHEMARRHRQKRRRQRQTVCPPPRS